MPPPPPHTHIHTPRLWTCRREPDQWCLWQWGLMITGVAAKTLPSAGPMVAVMKFKPPFHPFLWAGGLPPPPPLLLLPQKHWLQSPLCFCLCTPRTPPPPADLSLPRSSPFSGFKAWSPSIYYLCIFSFSICKFGRV